MYRPEYHGQGYATEAAQAFLQSLTQHFELKKLNICALAQSTNIRSIKVIEKLGFEKGGDAIMRQLGTGYVLDAYVWPGMEHMSKETIVLDRFGVEK